MQGKSNVVASMRYGEYRRDQVATVNDWPIVRSFTPTLGTWFWLAYRGADQDWYPLGKHCFDSLAEARRFAEGR